MAFRPSGDTAVPISAAVHADTATAPTAPITISFFYIIIYLAFSLFFSSWGRET
jgi:hypothetical protein